jgi:hypothetical protein
MFDLGQFYDKVIFKKMISLLIALQKSIGTDIPKRSHSEKLKRWRSTLPSPKGNHEFRVADKKTNASRYISVTMRARLILNWWREMLHHSMFCFL